MSYHYEKFETSSINTRFPAAGHQNNSVCQNVTIITFFIFNYPLTARVIEAPQITSQPLSSILLCCPLPSGT